VFECERLFFENGQRSAGNSLRSRLSEMRTRGPRSTCSLRSLAQGRLSTAVFSARYAQRTILAQDDKICSVDSFLLCGFAFEGALESEVESGLALFVLGLRDVTLLVFDLKLEEFFFQSIEQSG
jgi:hypothetical protein